MLVEIEISDNSILLEILSTTNIFYFKYKFGSIYSPSFNISKCKCGSSAISNTAEFPIVPILCPFSTFSSSDTNSVVNKLEYIVLNPF